MKQPAADYLPFHLPLIEEDDIRAVREVMESGWITTGPKSVQFERDVASYVGARQAVAVNSGTAALHLALEAIGLKEGDEAILPSLTFAATAEAVTYFKARPVLVDCEPETFNMDPVQVERAITPRTRVIIPVHFAGHPCDMSRILMIAREHGLKVVEDAAHAFSARYKGKMVGTLSDITCFSFYATKNITTGEGGIATTDNEDWADRMRIMRLHGISKDAWKRYSAEGSWRYEILAPGFKYNLTDMQAALGLSQLAKCNAMWMRRCALAQRYTDALGSLEAFEVPSSRSEVQHAWHLYVLRTCPGALNLHRDAIIEELKQRGIGTSVHFIPLHLHPYYRDTWGYRPGDFPVTEDYFDRCISLPLYPAMSEESHTRVVEALMEIAFLHRRSSKQLSYEPERVGLHTLGRVAGGRVAESHSSAMSGTNMGAPVTNERSSQTGKGSTHIWYLTIGKRVLDLCGALISLMLLLPLLAICALAVKLSSPGPVLFRQLRIGRKGRAFMLFKFRTMLASSAGPPITAAGDPRITTTGRLLRHLKLDELPQLINVLKGEMSLVGPRPEVPVYVESYNEKQKGVLELAPGITSPASLAYVDEEEALAGRQDCEDYYTQVVLPDKLDIDLAYCQEACLTSDLKILMATAHRVLLSGRSSSANAVKPRMKASGRTIQAPMTSGNR
jgi:dTDP-4-amino-4,6-dideoxygalactose transaminase/lipopolysaccharide/colanic/teichoic acid biosynthesis glycosyltransferase